MTNTTSGQQPSPTGRGIPKPYPTMPLEEALKISQVIFEHGASDKLRRLLVFDRLGRSPESSLSRTLVTSSSRYGLTRGGYSAEFLELTDDAKTIVRGPLDDAEVRRKLFEVSISSIESFNALYERLKNHRIPASDVLEDEMKEIGISEADCRKLSQVFLQNCRYIDLVREISGSERLFPIEQVVESLGATPQADSESWDPSGIDQSPDVPNSPNTSAETPRLSGPSLHIDIQIHIDSNATPKQIDQIFKSMSEHLYRS